VKGFLIKNIGWSCKP